MPISLDFVISDARHFRAAHQGYYVGLGLGTFIFSPIFIDICVYIFTRPIFPTVLYRTRKDTVT